MKKTALGILAGVICVLTLTLIVTKTTKEAQIIPYESPTKVATAATVSTTDQIIPFE